MVRCVSELSSKKLNHLLYNSKRTTGNRLKQHKNIALPSAIALANITETCNNKTIGDTKTKDVFSMEIDCWSNHTHDSKYIYNTRTKAPLLMTCEGDYIGTGWPIETGSIS